MAIPLLQRRKDIKAKLIERVENAVLDETITGVVIGKKTKRDRFNPPFIWLFIDEAIEDESVQIAEEWIVTVRIVGIIKEHDPLQGKEKAETLTIQAASAIQFKGIDEDRTLDSLVRDIVKTAFVSGEDEILDQDPTLWGSAMVLEMRFINKEVI